MEEDLFMKYAVWLDDKFDDCLDISFSNFDTPTIKILYDPTVDYNELCKSLPIEWIEYKDAGKLKIIMKKFTKDTEEYKETMEILNTPILRQKRKEIFDLFKK